MALARVLSPIMARVVIANPLQVKAIADAHVKPDKVDAGTLANLYAAGYLPEIWTPVAATERLRRLVARRYQIVRDRTRVKNEVHAILAAHLVPKCPHADLFNQRGRAGLARQIVPEDERAAIERNVRELNRLTEDQADLDREIALSVMEDASVRRMMTITGVNLTVAVGIMAAIGDIARFKSPQELVSYFGLNPRVRQSGLDAAHHGRISKIGRSHARATLVEAAWAAGQAPGALHAFLVSTVHADLVLPSRQMETSRRSTSRPSWARRIASPGSSASREGGRRNAAISRPTYASINARRQRRSTSSGGTAIGKDSEAMRVVSTVTRHASTRAASKS